MITITQRGDFSKTTRFLGLILKKEYLRDLEKYGKQGVEVLKAATPKDTGKTASSWDYEIHKSIGKASIVWTNSNLTDGIPVAVLIQYGHATGNGAFVQGIDYINPALKPVFDSIANSVWREVTNA